jgi:hypothetical protein
VRRNTNSTCAAPSTQVAVKLAGAANKRRSFEGTHMKKLLTALALSACALTAFAQPAPKHKGPCVSEAQSRGLKGEARTAFVDQCRSARKAERHAMRQGKGASCRAEAKARGLKGMEAREAVKACMHG